MPHGRKTVLAESIYGEYIKERNVIMEQNAWNMLLVGIAVSCGRKTS